MSGGHQLNMIMVRLVADTVTVAAEEPFRFPRLHRFPKCGLNHGVARSDIKRPAICVRNRCGTGDPLSEFRLVGGQGVRLVLRHNPLEFVVLAS